MDTSEHLIEHNTEGENVRSSIHLFPSQLLRRHISQCAQRHTLVVKGKTISSRLSRKLNAIGKWCQCLLLTADTLSGHQLLGQSEIHDFDMTFGREHDVRGF